jgi:hypothetical protein
VTVPLAKQWRPLDRSSVGRAPDRWGVYELGDEDGTVREVGWGVVRDELKDALAYADATQVRWETADSRDHARRLADDHRGRIDR